MSLRIVVQCLVLCALWWTAAVVGHAQPATSAAVSAAAWSGDFEQREFSGKISSGAPENQVTAALTTDSAHSGKQSLRLNVQLPERFRQVKVDVLNVAAGSLRGDLWGLQLWLKTRGMDRVTLSAWITEDDGETWGAWLPQQQANGPDAWYQVPVVLDLMQLIPWTRVNGKFERERVQTISIVMEPSGRGSVDGTVWLDDCQFLNAEHQVAGEQRDGFTMLRLDSVFNSDGVAFQTNPMDGDFHTGEWEPRTLPGEFFPKDPVNTFSGIPFLMPDVSDGKNNHIRCNGQVLAGFQPDRMSALYVLASGKFGDQLGNVVLHYDDGTSAPVMLEISDWSMGPSHGEVSAIKFPFAYHGSQREVRFPEIFLQSIRIDSSKRLSAIALPMRDHLKIFALTLASLTPPPAVATLQDRPMEEIYSRYERKQLSELDFTTTASSAGPFGGYLSEKHGSPSLNIPTYNGALTFQCDVRKFPNQMLIWAGQGHEGAPLELGGLHPIGEEGAIPQTDLLDWSTLVHRCVLQSEQDHPEFKLYLSRISPAALYSTGAKVLQWTGNTSGGPLRIACAQQNGVVVRTLADGEVLGDLAEPWLLVWSSAAQANGSTVPMLLVLERRPRKISSMGDNALRFDFEQGAGHVAAMPLQGIKRMPSAEMAEWEAKLTQAVLSDCRAWVRRLQSFPIGVQRQAKERGNRIEFTDVFNYLQFESHWNVEPELIAPVAPVVQLAREHGYPVSFGEDAWVSTSLFTFWGNFTYMSGAVVRFSIPRSAGIDQVLTPAYVTGEPLFERMRKQLLQLTADALPTNLNSSNCGDASQLRLFPALSLLTNRKDAAVEKYCRSVVRHQLEDTNLKVEKELMTGSYFLMDDRFWAKDEAYDKEWAIGLLLQGFWSEAYYLNDFDFMRQNWNKIAGLYRYYELIFDWASGSTYTMVTGVGANADGIRFAWEGMLAMARLAREVGDERLYQDATARSAMQMLNLYATWYLPTYSVNMDYTLSHERAIAPADVETRFAPDNMAEFFSCNSSRPKDFFQVVHALYIYNLSDLLFLHDFKLDKQILDRWLGITIREIHPQWDDGNVWSERSGRYYGSEQSMALLVAQALLLHEDTANLYASFIKSTENTRVLKEWYSPLGNAPFALAAMLTGRAPLIVAPVHYFNVTKNAFDSRSGSQQVVLQGRREGATALRVRCWGQPPQEVLIDGRPCPSSYDANADYLTVPLHARADVSTSIELNYASAH